MWIFELIDKIKTEQEKFSGSICLPVQIKEKQNALLLDALKCAKEKNLLFLCDENQNTLLHKFCEIPRPDAECLKFILKNAPNLANFQNNEGKLPSDILLEIEKKTLLSNRPIKVLLLECMQPGEKRTALDLSANMSLLERIDDTNPKINYCEYITSNYSSLLKRPTLLCFSGRYTFMPKEANGFAKIIRDSLDILHTPTPKIQTLAAWYPGHTLDLGCDLFAFLSPYVKADDDSPFFYVQRFVERYFKPLYTDKNGRPLDIEEASKNMRMINMIGYSYGGSIIQMISNQLTEDMKKVGYKIKEIKKIQSQICVFTIGYFANPNNYKNDFSSYHLVQKKDEASYDTLKNIIDKKQTDGRSFYISTLKKQPHQKI